MEKTRLTVDLRNPIIPSTLPPMTPFVPAYSLLLHDNTLHVPNEFDVEPHMNSVHSPIPMRGYHTNPIYPEVQGSQSFQDLHHLPPNAQNDTISISSRRSGRPTSSLVSLPLSHHGLVSNVASRPISRNLRCVLLLATFSRLKSPGLLLQRHPLIPRSLPELLPHPKVLRRPRCSKSESCCPCLLHPSRDGTGTLLCAFSHI